LERIEDVDNIELIDTVSKAMRTAWQLGQTYWRQADSDFTSDHRRSDETQRKYDMLVQETIAAISRSQDAPRCQCCGYLVTESEHRGCLRAAERSQDVARVALNDEQRRDIQECIDYLTPAAKDFSDLGMVGMGDSKHARCIRVLRSLLAPQPPQAGASDELASMTRMFHAACADLGAINEALGLDPDDGGAEPIIAAIEELRAERDKWVDANYAAPAAPAVAPIQTLPFAILPDEMEALRRFHECVTDGEGYDVPKDMMKRLSEIGLVRRVTANLYEHTAFGLSVLNGDFDAAPAPAEQPFGQWCKEEGKRLLAKCTPGKMVEDAPAPDEPKGEQQDAREQAIAALVNLGLTRKEAEARTQPEKPEQRAARNGEDGYVCPAGKAQAQAEQRAATLSRDAFYSVVRAALKEHRRNNPPRYLNDEQANAGDSEFATELADCHARISTLNGGARMNERHILGIEEIEALAIEHLYVGDDDVVFGTEKFARAIERAIFAASAGQADSYRSYFGDKHPGDVHQELLSAYAEIERLKVAAPTPAAAQTIGGSHESAGTQPVGTVTAHAMSQDERGKFEAWAKTNEGNCNDSDLRRSQNDGEYINKLVERDWEVWQARASASPVSGAARDVLAEAARKGWEAAMQFDTGEDGMEVAAYDKARDREINRIVAEIDRGERAGGKS
jgi:hypothetical protein